ncbi:MAG: 50S ribosomal protein L37ae [Candidatus Marsarchaeota archaeon]|jgi:large subunit ribosomal protein L37Ae|nr:50S ribosomal protein L37ae [Candidatus Marsarchaeota archaeon]MCL5111588.1 50S ribosomal protein L37ae [Candidatus Marsarchaeota archaeon]
MANASIRYGARVRKRYAAVKQQKRALYRCEMCGRDAVKRIGTSIWRCRHCGATYAGGAYSMTTAAGEVARRLVSDYARRR